MGAVKNKPGLQAPNHFFVRYSGVPVVYVESEDDSYIFGECWFKALLSRLEFLSVNSQSGSAASGCGPVIDAVHAEVASGNPSWGIVDRDAVMSKCLWDMVHETDDSRFDGLLPFGQRVKVLRRWEIESYLIDGEVLEQYRSELLMQVPRPSAEVWIELLADCRTLIPHAALNATRHVFNEKGLGDGGTNALNDRQEVESSLVVNVLTSLANQYPDCHEIYTQHVNQVEAFDAIGVASEACVLSLLRRVHGKAVLSRFKSRYGIQHDFRGLLAARIKTAGRVPEELNEFVQIAMSS